MKQKIWTSTAEQGDDGDVLDWVTDSEPVTGLYNICCDIYRYGSVSVYS